MGLWQELPEWAQELEEHLKEGETALFILHGQVFDDIRVNGDYAPFRQFLGHWLAQERHVVFYNLGLGLEFWDAPGENAFRQLCRLGSGQPGKPPLSSRGGLGAHRPGFAGLVVGMP